MMETEEKEKEDEDEEKIIEDARHKFKESRDRLRADYAAPPVSNWTANMNLFAFTFILSALLGFWILDSYHKEKWETPAELFRYMTEGIPRTISCDQIEFMHICRDRCDCHICLTKGNSGKPEFWRCQESLHPCDIENGEETTGAGCAYISKKAAAKLEI
jgi:hypothetical protein